MKRLFFALLGIALWSNVVLAQSSPGASKAQICLTCHQPEHRLSAMPLLEGQPAEYLYLQLKAYKDKQRSDPTMTMPSSAANLSDPDMREISAFFATQRPPNVAFQIDSSRVASGQYKAAEYGCLKCHITELSMSGATPRLAGQAVGYTVAQLQAFATNSRKHGIGASARMVAPLGSTDIDDLANYFAQMK